MILNCPSCLQDFERPEHVVKLNERYHEVKTHYCSRKCANITTFTGFRSLLRNSLKRNKEHTITLEEMKEVWDKQNGICAYTGVKLILITGSYNKKRTTPTYLTASLDRIDNSKGYVKDNIQFISIMANYAKNRGTHEEMLEFIEIIRNK